MLGGVNLFMISVLFSFLPIILIIFVIAIVISAKGEKSNSNQGGEEMIKSVYVYLVLFATLMMTIGGSVSAFMNLADIVAPQPHYQTFDEFRRWGGMERVKIDGTIEEIQLSDEELRAEYNLMVNNYKETSIERAKNNLVKSFGWIIIPLPVFIYFQRRLTKKNPKDE